MISICRTKPRMVSLEFNFFDTPHMVLEEYTIMHPLDAPPPSIPCPKNTMTSLESKSAGILATSPIAIHDTYRPASSARRIDFLSLPLVVCSSLEASCTIPRRDTRNGQFTRSNASKRERAIVEDGVWKLSDNRKGELAS